MKVIASAFIVLCLCGLVQAHPMTPIEEQGVGSESGEVMIEDELLGEETNDVSRESAIAPQTDESSDGVCSNIILASDFVFTGTRLRSLYTRSTLVCCSLCQDLEGCTTWTRNLRDGICELYATEGLSTFTATRAVIEMGGSIDGLNVSIIGEGTSPTADVDTLTAGTISPIRTVMVSAVFDESMCSGIRGATYPMGDVITAGYTRSAEFCCTVCTNSNDCVSWYFNQETSNCVLNRNVPEARQRSSSEFEGGVVAK